MEKIMTNLKSFKNRFEFREWLIINSTKEKECWIKNLLRGKPVDDNTFYYIDAVEEALCFGWIDSTFKKIDGIYYQRFSPRQKKSNWTVLNIARVKRLQDLGLMTENGLKCVPTEEFIYDKEIMNDIKNSGVFDIFEKFPELYKQIRVSNLASIKKNSIDLYKKSFESFVKKTKENKMIPGWDDYGRLK